MSHSLSRLYLLLMLSTAPWITAVAAPAHPEPDMSGMAGMSNMGGAGMGAHGKHAGMGMMGMCPMMKGMMGHGGMGMGGGLMIHVPALPPGHAADQLRMNGEIMRAVGTIEEKYASRLTH